MASNGNILEAVQLRKEFGGLVAVNTSTPRFRQGDRQPDRPERGRQDDVLQHAHGRVQATRHRHVEEVDRGPAASQGHSPWDGAHVQNIRLFHNMTALENVMVAMHSRIKGGVWASIIRTPRLRREEAGARDGALDLLEFTGLRRRAGEYAKNLPYGDQRRLEVARALATDPQLLLLDEPTAGMNPEETASFTASSRSSGRSRSLTILLIEHDMRVVMGISDRVTVLDYGEKIAEGTRRKFSTTSASSRRTSARRPREEEHRSEHTERRQAHPQAGRHPHVLRDDSRAQGDLDRGARR